jgi:hypothetical protein
MRLQFVLRSYFEVFVRRDGVKITVSVETRCHAQSALLILSVDKAVGTVITYVLNIAKHSVMTSIKLIKFVYSFFLFFYYVS